MGLFDRIKDPVRGTARVLSVHGDPGSSKVDVQLVVQPEGMTPSTVEVELRRPADVGPVAGDLLPVTVDRKHHDRLEVDWDSVRAARTAGWGQPVPGAGATAAASTTPGPPGTPTGFVDLGSVSTPAAQIPPEAQPVVDQLRQMFPNASIQVQSAQLDASVDPALHGQIMGAVEMATGQDLDRDGVVGPAGPTAPDADRVTQLERLAKLKDSGALTDEEFQAAKAKILGSG